MYKKPLFAVILALIAYSLGFGQFTLTGEIRPRAEYSHGYKELASSGQDASFFTSQRTRLNMHFSGDKFKTYVSLQDVRVWGNQPQLVGNEDFAASIHEAWGELQLFKDGYLKAGRQEVIYDNHRIFGSVGWAQQARSHDMVIFKYEGALKAHFALAYHENTNRKNNIYNGPDAYKALQLVWLAKKFENLNISLLFLNNGVPFAERIDTINNVATVSEESIVYSQTIGPRATYKWKGLSLAGNFYYQTGRDANKNDLNAYEFALEGSYKLESGFLFTLGFEQLSGTDFDETSENKSFTPFYGTNHKFNGFMDYFYVGNHMNSVGLNDLYIKAKYAKGKFWVAGHLHFFSSAAKINTTVGNNLGTELDFWGGLNISNETNIKIGYSQMFASESMEVLKGGSKDEVNNWAWIMITFKPTLFKSKD